jgi:membrane associated rhomboid family serine protease
VILNIWTLWLFSPPIDDRLDHIRYLVFYIACGVAASEVAARSRRQGVSSGALGVVK